MASAVGQAVHVVCTGAAVSAVVGTGTSAAAAAAGVALADVQVLAM